MGVMEQQVTSDAANCALLFICLIFPPLAVLVKKNACQDYDVLISLLLTLVFFFPGMIFSMYVVFKYWKGCHRGDHALPFLEA